MRRPGCSAFAVAAMLAGGAAIAAPLTPDSGALTVSGELKDGAGTSGRFELKAVLREGNFSGTATLDIGGNVIAGPLLVKRSYLENGNCYFRFESGKARAEVRGKCDSSGLQGQFETFAPGDGGRTGAAKAQVVLGPKPEASPSASASAEAPRLPSGKLLCAYTDRQLNFKWGGATEYSLRTSNMVSLTLNPAGSYSAGPSARGSFARAAAGDKIRLTSGTWEGAVGTLERDRSGMPAVVFHIEENRLPNGVHVVDPYTTRCTTPRKTP